MFQELGNNNLNAEKTAHTVKQSELKADQRKAIREKEKGEKFLLLLVGKAGEMLQ